MSAELVLLDLDGVLVDTVHSTRAVLEDWLGERATPAVVSAWEAAQRRWFAAWRRGEIGWQEQRRRRLREVLPLLGEPIGSDDELDAVFASGYEPAYRRSWRAFDDAAPAIAELHRREVRTAVLTNGSEELQIAKLVAVGLVDVAGPVFTAEALRLRKPDPRAFLTVCDRLGADPSAVLYVGDEHEVDVLGARTAGLAAVLLDRDGSAPPEERSVLTTLRDLPAFVAR